MRDEGSESAAKLLTKDEARRIAEQFWPKAMLTALLSVALAQR